MAETLVNLYEAKTTLSQLVDRAAAGEEIIIAKNGVPLARLVQFAGPRKRRRPGGWEGRVYIAEDFEWHRKRRGEDDDEDGAARPHPLALPQARR